MSRRKELDFFVEVLSWGKGTGWYEAYFPEPRAVRGETSPSYSAYPQYARIIYLVRDPVERTVAGYDHQHT